MSVLSAAVADVLLGRATKKAKARARADEKEARAAQGQKPKPAKGPKTAGEKSLLDFNDTGSADATTSPENLFDYTRDEKSANSTDGGGDTEDAETHPDAIDFVEADGLRLTADEVETILKRYNIPTTASRAVPVPLRATRIQFAGIKLLPTSHQDATGCAPLTPAELAELVGSNASEAATGDADRVDSDADDAESADDTEAPEGTTESLAAVEFDWLWEPPTGVNGIGSAKNLRGKSTVLNVLMWALSGRCANLQPDVKSWIRTVQVDWRVGNEHIRVKFNNRDGHPTGTVDLVDNDAPSTERTLELGSFDGEEQFEGVMGSVMMTRLRLEEIPVWTVDRPVRHKWPAYASAFTVRADNLNPVVGNVTELGIRMLQMFVGTDWGPSLAATSTALGELRAEKTAAKDKASAASDVLIEAKGTAQAEVERLTAALNAIPAGTPDVRDIIAGVSIATQHARTLHELERQLMTASANEDTIKLQLRTAKARNHTALEDKLASRFFHQMTPSRCPRCTAAVTAAQMAAEVDKHECSLCAKDLELEKLDVDNFAVGREAENGDVDAPVEDVSALEQALLQAKRASQTLSSQITDTAKSLAAAEQSNQMEEARIAAAEERRQLELALAHAEGALAAFGDASEPKTTDRVDPSTLLVLTVAEKLLGDWMRDGQNPLLATISRDIEALAVGFGADSLSNVRLGGGGVMKLLKHGKSVTYSKVTDGEMLRLKIATAVALIKHGSVAGVGRHPGFLVLDSPAAEEMPEEDLAVLIEALIAVANQAQMQIFVGTRNTGPLVDLLEPPHRVIASGEKYLW